MGGGDCGADWVLRGWRSGEGVSEVPSAPSPLAHVTNVEKRRGSTRGTSCCLLLTQWHEEGRVYLLCRVSTPTSTLLMMYRWIAYQLLHALAQCHEAGVCHGDLKSENVLLTSWT